MGTRSMMSRIFISLAALEISLKALLCHSSSFQISILPLYPYSCARRRHKWRNIESFIKTAQFGIFTHRFEHMKASERIPNASSFQAIPTQFSAMRLVILPPGRHLISRDTNSRDTVRPNSIFSWRISEPFDKAVHWEAREIQLTSSSYVMKLWRFNNLLIDTHTPRLILKSCMWWTTGEVAIQFCFVERRRLRIHYNINSLPSRFSGSASNLHNGKTKRGSHLYLSLNVPSSKSMCRPITWEFSPSRVSTRAWSYHCQPKVCGF